jgi:hypothetical protein
METNNAVKNKVKKKPNLIISKNKFTLDLTFFGTRTKYSNLKVINIVRKATRFEN